MKNWEGHGSMRSLSRWRHYHGIIFEDREKSRETCENNGCTYRYSNSQIQSAERCRQTDLPGKWKEVDKNAASYCKVATSETGPGCTKNSTRSTIHPSPPIIDSCHTTAILQPSSRDTNPEHRHEVARMYSM